MEKLKLALSYPILFRATPGPLHFAEIGLDQGTMYEARYTTA